MAVRDFSRNIEGLVDSLIRSADRGGLSFVGKFYGFDAVVKHRALWNPGKI